MYKKFRKIALVAVMFVCLVSFATKVYATDGAIDETFNSNGLGGQLAGFNAIVSSALVQPDGKIVVTGAFTSYDGTPVNYIARLNQNGTLDTTFATNVGTGFNALTDQVDIQPNGQILVSGNFTSFNGVTANGIARLNTDGTLDTTFATNVGTGFQGGSATTRLIMIDPVAGSDYGKIIVGGAFLTFDGVSDKGIARLNSDGTPDTTFNGNIGSVGQNNTLYRAAFQPDGKIIIAGNFTSILGTTVRGVVRLNENGTLDTTFNTGGAGGNGSFYGLYLLSNGEILVSGNVDKWDGAYTTTSAGGYLFELTSSGALDNTFNSGGVGAYGETDNIFPQPNGKFIIYGVGLSSYNGTTEHGIARINSNGTLDTTFSTGTGFGSGWPESGASSLDTVFTQDGSLIVPGSFSIYNGTSAGNLVAIQMDTANPVVSNISTTSNNANTSYAKTGNIVTLSFNVNHPLTSSTITMGGQSVTPSCTAGSGTSISCTATLTISPSAPNTDGPLPFSITVTTVGGTTGPISTTSDGSSVTVYQTTPTNPTITVSSPTTNPTPTISGTCSTGDTVTVTIGGQTLTATCSGSAYTTTPTSLTSGSTYTINATQADPAGNISSQATTSLVIQPNTYTLTYIAGANGTLSGTATQTVAYGGNGTAVTAVPNNEYSFVNWSDNSTQNPRTDTNITSNLSVTANFTTSATIPPILTSPASSSSDVNTNPLTITYTLPEDQTPGSIILTFTPTSGTPITIHLSNVTPAVQQTLTLPLTGGIQTLSGVSSSSSNSIPVGTYSVTLTYQDAAGGIFGTATATGITITAPIITASSSTSSSVSGGCGLPFIWNPQTGTCTNPQSSPSATMVSTVSIANILGSGACPSSLLITQNLRDGDRNETYDEYNQGIVTQVNILQQQINRILAASYNQAAGPVDGIFGTLTKQGVERLQAALNTALKPNPLLKIDGIVGPFTKAAMNNSCGTL